MRTISGKAYQPASGITMDAPPDIIPESPETLMFWADSIGQDLMIPDVQVTRRLKAHLYVDRANGVIRAFATIREMWAYMQANDLTFYATVATVTDECITYRLSSGQLVRMRK